MPRTFTVAQLRARVRELVDIESARSFTDPEINERLSSGYAKYYAKLVKAGLGYAGEQTQTITSTGTDAYALQPDHFATVRVDFQYQGNYRWPLEELDVRELQQVQFQGSQAFFYRLVGQNIVLYPTPPAGGIYQHIYVPAPADLTDDTQIVDGVAGWEDAVVLDAAIRCLMKAGEDASLLMTERKLVEDRIDEEADMRSLMTNRRIVQTDRRRTIENFDPSDWPPWTR